MSITIADLLTRFSADTSDLDAGTARANQNISRFQQTSNSMFGSLQSVGGVALGVAGGGLVALGAGFAGAGFAGLGMNREMENVTAQLNAFTKDGAKSAEILDMIRERAAKTPFEFNEMAKATAGLLPAAKASGQGLESLVEKAEILAASNPAQGLEGAAFALREAVSGDFTSIIERFNLPRSYINKLKEEGVPALEIVSRAMAQVGFDTDLVANLAETADGRWSTFKDTFVSIAATITKPIFAGFSSGLGNVNKWLTENEPKLTELANIVSIAVDGAFSALTQTFGGTGDGLSSLIDIVFNGISIFAGVTSALADFAAEGEELSTRNFGLKGSIAEVADSIVTLILNVWDGINAVVAFVQPILQTISQFVSWQDIMTTLGIAIAAVIIPAILSFVAAMAPIVATIGLVIAAVSLLRNAWENDWGGIQEKVAAVWGALKGAFEAIQSWLNETFPNGLAGLMETWQANWAAMKEGFDIVWSALSAVWETISTWLTTTLPDAVTSLKNGWSSGWESVKNSTSTQWTSIRSSFDSMRNWLDATLPASVTGFGTSSETGFESIKTSIVGKFDTVIATFRSIQTWLNSTLTSALDTFKNALNGLSFSNPFSSIVTAIEAVPDAISSARTTIANFVTWLSSLRVPDIFSMLNLPDWLTDYVGGGKSGTRSGSRLAGLSTATALALPMADSGFNVDTLATAIVRAFAQAPPVVRAEFMVSVKDDPAATAVSYQVARKVGEILNRRTG